MTEDEFINWLLKEPQTLVWLPTLHRMAAAESGNQAQWGQSTFVLVCLIQIQIGLFFLKIEIYKDISIAGQKIGYL